MEVLSAFIREHSREQWPLPRTPPHAPTPAHTTRPDVQAALTVLRRRNAASDVRLLDLRGADLTDAELFGADLAATDFHGADLTRANLRGTDLFGANFTDADLTGADLTDAKPFGANFTRATLRDVKWPRNQQVPDGWEPGPDPERLHQADAGAAG